MNNEPTSEQKLRDTVKGMKSTLEYIEDDIENVMARVSSKPYKHQIPNLYEKLTLFGEGLTTIKIRLKKILDQIHTFENRLSMLRESEANIVDSTNLEEYRELVTQMEKIKIDYKILKSKIILFTESLDKNI